MPAIDLDIATLELVMNATASADRAQTVRRRVCDAVRGGIERELARWHGDAPRPATHALVFIDRIQFDCTLGGEWTDREIAARVGEGIARSLGMTLANPSIIAFRDRADFVAAFVVSLLQGIAWRWWFDEFDGLRPLSTSGAIRTVVINEGDAGLTALARMSPRTLEDIVRGMTQGDIRQLVASIASRKCGASDASYCWARSGDVARHADTHAGWLLALAAAERDKAGLAGAETLAQLRAMVALRRGALTGSLDGDLIDVDRPVASLRLVCEAAAIEDAWIDALSDTEAAAILADLSALVATRGDMTHADTSCPSTRHGGAFILLYLLCRLGWADEWAKELEGTVDRPVACSLVKALCVATIAEGMSPDDANALYADPALRLALSVDAAATLLGEHETAALRALRSCWRHRRNGRDQAIAPSPLPDEVRRAALHLLRELSRRLPGLAGSSAQYLRANVLALPARATREDDTVVVHLGRAPLDVLLVLSGYKRGTCTLPDGIRLELREDFGT